MRNIAKPIKSTYLLANIGTLNFRQNLQRSWLNSSAKINFFYIGPNVSKFHETRLISPN